LWKKQSLFLLVLLLGSLLHSQATSSLDQMVPVPLSKLMILEMNLVQAKSESDKAVSLSQSLQLRITSLEQINSDSAKLSQTLLTINENLQKSLLEGEKKLTELSTLNTQQDEALKKVSALSESLSNKVKDLETEVYIYRGIAVVSVVIGVLGGIKLLID
jgi:hypothetical protein